MSPGNYVIKFVIDLRQVGDFSRGIPVSPAKTTARHDITEILLKVMLNPMTLTLITTYKFVFLDIIFGDLAIGPVLWRRMIQYIAEYGTVYILH